MTFPNPQLSARRNLVRRMKRFVERITKDDLRPNVDATANLAIALEHLERGDYPAGCLRTD